MATGGFWKGTNAKYSKETHDLLKLMMNESKLTNLQQRKLNRVFSDGKSLPVTKPTRTTKSSHARKMPKSLNPRNYSGHTRTKNQIESSGDLKPSNFKPPPGRYISEKDKDRLINLMAYGESPDEAKTDDNLQNYESESTAEVDRFDELQQEIEEREQFLNEMRELGKEKQYKAVILTEISQKIREMELIDKKRTYDLEEALKCEERKLFVPDS